MDKQYILFDLDGTLTDSMEGITKSVQFALKYFGIEVEDREQLRPFIGPPLVDSFMKYFGMSLEDANTAVEKYREYFGVKGLYENQVYDGIKELLIDLKQAGKILIVATSKPTGFSETILNHFDILDYFSSVNGASMDGSHSEKIDVMRQALKVHDIQNTDQAVMIGDRRFDMEAAKELNVESIGVLYGFGSREELAKAEAVHIVETVGELRSKLLS